MLFCTILNFYFKYTFLLMMYWQIKGSISMGFRQNKELPSIHTPYRKSWIRHCDHWQPPNWFLIVQWWTKELWFIISPKYPLKQFSRQMALLLTFSLYKFVSSRLRILFTRFKLNFYFVLLDECKLALGMQSGEIPDSAITASSSYDNESVGPANGR